MTYCGLNCCEKCDQKAACGGCEKVGGCPFGGKCVCAELVKTKGKNVYEEEKRKAVEEINALSIEGLELSDLNLLNGSYVNLSYPLTNGETVKFLSDKNIYWGNQIEKKNSDRCYGVVADMECIVVAEYGCYGADPELIAYKKRS